MKISKVLSKNLIAGKTDDISEDIDVYLYGSNSVIKEGDIISFDGYLYANFDE